MQILEVYIKKLRYKRYAENTIDSYVPYLKEFLLVENIKDPYQVSTKQITNYLESKTYTSVSQQNQVIGSLKLFAKHVLGKKDMHLNKIERPRAVKKLQPVIPKDELLNSLTAIENLKHKTILTLAYSKGLRVSEIINLKWEHISRSEKTILIKYSKNNKDRLLPINKTIIDILIDYAREYKTRYYVFKGQDWRPQYTAESCNKLIKKYLGKKYHFHTLRKSYAVHLYELGVDLAKIQDILGHSRIETTRIYVTESIEALRTVPELV